MEIEKNILPRIAPDLLRKYIKILKITPLYAFLMQLFFAEFYTNIENLVLWARSELDGSALKFCVSEYWEKKKRL